MPTRGATNHAGRNRRVCIGRNRSLPVCDDPRTLTERGGSHRRVGERRRTQEELERLRLLEAQGGTVCVDSDAARFNVQAGFAPARRPARRQLNSSTQSRATPRSERHVLGRTVTKLHQDRVVREQGAIAGLMPGDVDHRNRRRRWKRTHAVKERHVATSCDAPCQRRGHVRRTTNELEREPSRKTRIHSGQVLSTC